MRKLFVVCFILVLAFVAVSQELAQNDPLAEVNSWGEDEGVLAVNNSPKTATKPTEKKVESNLDGKSPFIFNGANPDLKKTKTVEKPAIPTVNPKAVPPVAFVPPVVPPQHTKCLNNTYVYINVTKVVHKKAYVPYYIYYSPHQYITGQAAIYLTSLISKVKELKSRLRTFRTVLKHLLQKKVIGQTLYSKTDKVVLHKIIRIEQAIKQRKLTVKQINAQLETIYAIFKRLDYNINIPVDCDVVVKTGKKCKGAYVKKITKKGKKRFVQERVFTKVIVNRIRSKITALKKHKRTISLVRQGKGYEKKTIRINPNLKKLILSKAITVLLKNAPIKIRVKKFIARLKASKSVKVRNACKDKKKKRSLIRKFLLRKYKKSITSQCKSILASPYVKNLRKTQYKDSVKIVKREGKVTKEIIRLPRNIIASESRKNLIKFASLKYGLDK